MAVGPTSPVIVLCDIETTPNLGWTWRKWEQDVIRFEKEWELLSFGYKVLGSKTTKCIARPDFADKTDRSLTKAIWKIVDECDVLIGHNIDRFDNPRIRAKFVEHELPPPAPYKTIDTLKIARSQFQFNSNRLDDLGRTLKLGRKVKTGGVDLWFDCMDGDRSAWRKLVAYNKQDVDLLLLIYERLKTWYPSHPNLSLYTDRPGCPVCKSVKVQRRGFNVMRMRTSPRFQCRDCSHWFSGSARAA